MTNEEKILVLTKEMRDLKQDNERLYNELDEMCDLYEETYVELCTLKKSLEK